MIGVVAVVVVVGVIAAVAFVMKKRTKPQKTGGVAKKDDLSPTESEASTVSESPSTA